MHRPGPKAILSIALVSAIIVLAVYALVSTPGTADLPNTPSKFTVNGHTFAITYVATDQSARESGLMNKKITNDTTMLFIFPTAGVYSFWMSNVNSSLDIIWLNVTGGLGRVVYLRTDLPGCSSSFCPVYEPSSTANYVLEASAGFANSNSIRLNTTIQFG